MSKPSSQKRMRHGITSRSRSDDRFYDVMDLAKLLSRPAPACTMVFNAAMDLADAILHLSDITQAQVSMMSCHVPDDVTDVDPLVFSLAAMRLNAKGMTTLAAYERKARSRRDRLIRHLDHMILEARRREAEEQARIRAICGKFGPFD